MNRFDSLKYPFCTKRVYDTEMHHGLAQKHFQRIKSSTEAEMLSEGSESITKHTVLRGCSFETATSVNEILSWYQHPKSEFSLAIGSCTMSTGNSQLTSYCHSQDKFLIKKQFERRLNARLNNEHTAEHAIAEDGIAKIGRRKTHCWYFQLAVWYTSCLS